MVLSKSVAINIIFHCWFFLENNIQLSKLEDLIGFMKKFKNWPVFHLASREMLWRVIQNGRFLWEGQCGKKLLAKERISSGKLPSLKGKGKGFYWVDYLIFWGMERAHVTDSSLMLVRKFLTNQLTLHF